ncbi:hypothetical protein G3O08_01370 [Cryomorpha ignava]|uniref:Uncharacterized protein n=1 Tax=Cryomorpha ignava TaxID=101383 RepID=A0A7K3WMA9_9FLAO|nr:hypothetical protein [Cryomorpha ignava]NEN22151.1 hypothetical protein [Cryomorpha ignava]
MEISWSRVMHRGAERIKIDFPYNQKLSNAIRAEAGARWSKTLKAWHVKDSNENIEKILVIVEKMMKEDNDKL